MFQTADRRVQRPRGRAVSLTGSGGWLEEQGRLAKGVRGGAGEGRAGPSSASQTGNWGALGGFRVKGGQSALLGAGSPGHNSATVGLTLHPGASSPESTPFVPPRGSSSPWASHQACVVRVHALCFLHDAGEAAGAGRGAGEVLQHFCSLGRCLRSATEHVPSASICAGHLLSQDPRSLPSLPRQAQPAASQATPWHLIASGAPEPRRCHRPS